MPIVYTATFLPMQFLRALVKVVVLEFPPSCQQQLNQNLKARIQSLKKDSRTKMVSLTNQKIAGLPFNGKSYSRY